LQIQHIHLPHGPISLFVPDEESVPRIFRQLREKNSLEPFPYWARLWPSATALATFIRQNPDYVKGRSVAELGAGIGLPSLVSAPLAKTVWCSDLVAEAVSVAAQSALLHGFTNMKTETCNWEMLPGNLQPDVLLLSDVNYEPKVFAPLQAVMLSFLEKGTTILLATPQRLMAKPFIEKLLPFVLEQSVHEVVSNNQTVPISVFVLQKS
jgi:methyltransferase-like protein 23